MNAAKMHPMVEKTFLKAAKMVGADLDPVPCFGWLLALHEAAEAVTDVPIADLCADIDAPLLVGNRKLWMPSVSQISLIWRLEDVDSEFSGLLPPFILSVGRDPVALKELESSTDAMIIEKAREWARGTNCSYEALCVATDWIYSAQRTVSFDESDKNRFGPPQRRDWASLVSELIKEFGGKADDWIYGCSYGQIRARSAFKSREDEIEAVRRSMAERRRVSRAPGRIPAK